MKASNRATREQEVDYAISELIGDYSEGLEAPEGSIIFWTERSSRYVSMEKMTRKTTYGKLEAVQTGWVITLQRSWPSTST